jgi:uncharacterized protein (TIGR02001 family)
MSRRNGHAKSHGARHCARLLVAFGLLWFATPVSAELGASVSISSNDRFRGHSLSQGRPVAALDLSYDDPTGIYLGGSATSVATAHSGLQFLGLQGNVGYARQLGSEITIDIGVVHSHYAEYFSGGYATNYDEAYLGLITQHVATHIYYSPDYFGRGYSTIYAEFDGIMRPAHKWRLNAHLGLLAQMRGHRAPGYDWRIGVARQLGAFDLQLAWAGSGPAPDYYANREQARSGLTFVVVCAF